MCPVPTGAAPTPPPPVWDRTAAFLYVPGELLGLGWGKAFHPLAVAVQEGFLGMGASPPLATWVPRCSSSLLPPGTWGWQCSASPLPPRCGGERAVPFVSRVSFLSGGRMGIFSRHCSAQEAAIRRVGERGNIAAHLHWVLVGLSVSGSGWAQEWLQGPIPPKPRHAHTGDLSGTIAPMAAC